MDCENSWDSMFTPATIRNPSSGVAVVVSNPSPFSASKKKSRTDDTTRDVPFLSSARYAGITEQPVFSFQAGLLTLGSSYLL